MSRSYSDRPFLGPLQGPSLLALALAGAECTGVPTSRITSPSPPSSTELPPTCTGWTRRRRRPGSRERTEVARGRAAPGYEVRLANTSRPGKGQNHAACGQDEKRSCRRPSIRQLKSERSDRPRQPPDRPSDPVTSQENIRDDDKRTGYPGDPGQERTGDPNSAVDPFDATTADELNRYRGLRRPP